MAQYQAKTQDEIYAEILTNITSNGMGNITGLTLQQVLTDITTTAVGSNFVYPADPSLQTSDVGKLVMNNGSGSATVYQLSPVQGQQLGKWSITPDNFGVFGSSTEISINMAGNTYNYIRADWDWPYGAATGADNPSFTGGASDTGPSGPPPATTVAQELNYLRLFLMGQPQFAGVYNFYLSPDGNTLYINELVFQGTIVYVTGFGKYPLQIIQSSTDSFPPAPAYFPLGKLVGLTDIGALISCNRVETYTLDPTIGTTTGGGWTSAQVASNGITPGQFSVLNNLFSYLTPLNITSNQAIYNLSNQIIIPSSNGTATFFDLSKYSFNSDFWNQFQGQFLGFALSSTATTVTVYNIAYLSFFASLFVRAIREGIFQIGSTTEGPFSPPATGSGSGSGSGFGG